MRLKRTRPVRLPYVIASIGIILSLILWYILEFAIQPYYDFLNKIKPYFPHLTLLLCIFISILIAIMIATTQLSRQRAQSLKKTNMNLKKEMMERISAEETKQNLEEALLQGQKLQAIGTLAGGIAHDFNNILYAIIGYIELSRQDVPEDSLVYKNLGRVLEGAHRGQDLVARILSFSRRTHPKLSLINLKATIENALSLLRRTIPASVTIDFQATHDVKILGNKTLIHQVFVNIINNAVDAMEGEGTITIQMSIVSKENPLLKQFPNMLPQNYCKIEIEDTGHGMDKSTINRIFEPFFTTKEVGKGTGLGLSIVHTILKEHNGDIRVTSHLGHGSIFTILLPVEEEIG